MLFYVREHFMNKHQSQGFTLLEAVIVMAILGIVAAIAIPSYRSHVLSTHRKAAIGDMLSLQQQLARDYNFNHGAYSKLGDTTIGTGSCNTTAASVYNSGSPTRYALTVVTTNNAQAYTITATPCTNQAKDECGYLRLSSDGTRLSKGKKSGSNVSGYVTDGKCF